MNRYELVLRSILTIGVLLVCILGVVAFVQHGVWPATVVTGLVALICLCVLLSSFYKMRGTKRVLVLARSLEEASSSQSDGSGESKKYALGIGPYPDCATPRLIAVSNKNFQHLQEFEPVYTSWDELASGFTAEQFHACMHNQTLIGNYDLEQPICFFPLYFFYGNFLIVSTEYLQEEFPDIPIVLETKRDRPPGFRIPNNIDAAQMRNLLTKAKNKWVVRGVDFEEFYHFAYNRSISESDIYARTSIVETSLHDGKAEILSIGADEAYTKMEEGKYVILATSRDYDYRSLNGLFMRLSDWEDDKEYWTRLVENLRALYRELRLASIRYLDGNKADRAFFESYAKDISMPPNGRVALAEAEFVALSLKYCLEPLYDPIFGFFRKREVKHFLDQYLSESSVATRFETVSGSTIVHIGRRAAPISKTERDTKSVQVRNSHQRSG